MSASAASEPPGGEDGPEDGLPRVGHLGPQGTFTEEALLAGAQPGACRPVAQETIQDTILALGRGEVEWAIAPIENSLDGTVTVTLDLLVDLVDEIQIVGEELLSVRHLLSAAEGLAFEGIQTVLTHPQVPGQCRRFLREQLAGARVVPASSTADAVRLAASADLAEGLAAIGTALAAEIYGAKVLADGVQDRDDNLTRFAWLGPRSQPAAAAPLRPRATAARKTSLVFWGAGADHSGWLVQCLDKFARRQINLTKIESRPTRERMGHYMFFVDLEGDAQDELVAAAIDGLRRCCEEVRVLGSYAAAASR
ncbi:MAG TPA: prephenate dehydratase [Solirubrobacteraceae bacterium]|jgi:prephenate dehydratase